MNDIFDYSFRKIIALSASDSPTPGGGSISAMVGVLGATMTAMVGNLTVGKSKYKHVEDEVKEITGYTYFIINKLEKLVQADIDAFNSLMKVFRMPRNTEEEKARRSEKMGNAAKAATEVPIEIARTLKEALRLAERMAGIGNKMVISDAGVATYICEAALNAVLLNVDINVPLIKDVEYVNNVLDEKEKLVQEAKELKKASIEKVLQNIK